METWLNVLKKKKISLKIWEISPLVVAAIDPGYAEV